MTDTLTPLLTDDLSTNDQACLAVLDAVLAAFGCPTGTLHTVHDPAGPLHLRAQRGIPVSLMHIVTEIPLGKGIAGAAAQDRAAVQLCNLQQDLGGVAKPDARQTGVCGSLAVPLLDGEVLKGTLGIGKFEPYEFTEAETERLWEVSRAIAKALD